MSFAADSPYLAFKLLMSESQKMALGKYQVEDCSMKTGRSPQCVLSRAEVQAL
jgi:hypothetical protein